ncbi:hypothetical protein F5Y03DRAFT_342191 [Xylaria venustula]|nr:hypothetical protein F5Y03DRAFT_342191 [Xylaria venustula]
MPSISEVVQSSATSSYCTLYNLALYIMRISTMLTSCSTYVGSCIFCSSGLFSQLAYVAVIYSASRVAQGR